MRRALTGTVTVLAAALVIDSQEMKLPAGCVAAASALVSHEGYASRIIHRKTGVELVLVPAGTLDILDVGVTLARPFYVGTTEVTNAQYGRFVERSGYDGRADVDPAYDNYLLHLRGASIMPDGDDFPAIFVSWYNARGFCRWAGDLDLPTQAEWEYCCRAGESPEAISKRAEEAHAYGRYGWASVNSGGQTHRVAQLEPNAWGLHDMHGNVWEWCLDDYVSRTAPPSDGSPRRADRMTRVLMGGSWSNARTWARRGGGPFSFSGAPVNTTNDIGFRVVLRPWPAR